MQSPEKRDFLDIEEVSAEIRERVRRKANAAGIAAPAEAAARRPVPTRTPVPWRLTASDELWQQVTGGQLLVGSMPPSPPTLRGRLGRILVEVVRRSLFWLTPQIQAFQRAAAIAIREQAGALREISGSISGLTTMQASLRSVEEHVSTLNASLRLVEDQTKTLQASLRSDIEVLTGTVQAQMERLTADAAGLRKGVDQHTAEIQAEIGAREAIGFHVGAIAEDLQKVGRSLAHYEELRTKLRQLEEFSRSSRADLMLQQQQLKNLRPGTPLDGAGGIRPEREEPDRVAEQHYLEFEQSFRGSYEDIQTRLSVYLDRLEGLPFGETDSPCVDLGCGRGEWLGLLRERGVVAYGVDSNSAMVNACRQDGLVVQQEDLLPHLRSLPAESRGGITAFHVVEHLPAAVLEAFLDEALRVLKPNGILILETPNPRNVLVGSNTFYLDPTHQKPLPPDLLKFLVQARGFAGIEVMPLHPYPDEAKLNIPGNAAAGFIDEHFFGPQDYAVVCRKPQAAEPAGLE